MTTGVNLKWLKFKSAYVILHIPTGLYICDKPSLSVPSYHQYQLANKPLVFTVYFGITYFINVFLQDLLRHGTLNAMSDNFMFVVPNGFFDIIEFELVKI